MTFVVGDRGGLECADGDATEHSRQADVGGAQFDYPPEAFDQGALGGLRVPCLSRDQQQLFHTGYEPRPVDLLDLDLLEGLTSHVET